MSDSSALLPASVLRNLSDKLYEKRKNAALEVEGIVRSLTAAGDHERVTGVINILINDFAKSPQANHRKAFNQNIDSPLLHAFKELFKNIYIQFGTDSDYHMGGLIGLAAATVGLATEAAQHLDKIVPPVLDSFTDQDSRVRYYACEALYNIAKVSRGDFIVFFNQIFDALCKLSADSDPNVQSAAHLLDRLVKDIVTESDQFRCTESSSPHSDSGIQHLQAVLLCNSGIYCHLTVLCLGDRIEEFIPLLRERMNVLNPFVRQFLVGWITVLDSVPDIDMLGFLPDFLDGLFNMLSDPSHEIRQQADSALTEFLLEIKNAPVGLQSVDYGRMAEILVQRAGSPDEFTRLTSITWVNEFVKLGGDQLVPYYSAILGAILPCISDKEEKIRVVARETNEELRFTKADPAEGFVIEAVLEVARRELASEWEATRIEALRWIQILLEKHRTEVLSFLDQIFPALLQSLSDASDEVVLLVLDVQAYIAQDSQHFRYLMVFLVKQFRESHSLLEKRGTLAVRRLCTLLDAERVYRELATILEGEADLEFATIMVQALNLILLTASELADLRTLLKQSLSTSTGRDLFVALYSSWCHSPMATVSLCLLAQAYTHASSVIQSLGESDINVNLLVQVDKLVRLLETPIFAYLRLQLLEAGRQPALLKTLYGLLMLLPQQSSAFKILRTRLKTVPAQAFVNTQPSSSSTDFPGLSAIRRTASGGPYAQILSHIPAMPTGSQPSEDGVLNSDSSNCASGINFVTQLQQFEHMQHQHRIHRVTQLQSKKLARRPPVAPVQNGPAKVDDPVDQKRGKGVPPIDANLRGGSRSWRA